jgi:hypothetical protein
MTDILQLNEKKLAAALRDPDNLYEVGLEDVSEWTLDALSETGAVAVCELVGRTLSDWECLRQPDGCNYEVGAYALWSEYENNIIVVVGDRECYTARLCSLTVDANRLADDQWGRTGPEVLVEVLRSVLDEANRVLEAASSIPVPPTR